MHRRRIAIGLLLLATSSGVVRPSTSVAIDHLATPFIYDNLGNGLVSGQTFVASFETFAGIRVFIGDPSSPDEDSLSALTGPADLVLYDASDLNAPVEIARRRIACAGEVLSGEMDFFLSSPQPLVSGRKYFFGIQTDDPFGLGISRWTFPGGAEAWIVTDSDPSVITEHFSGRDINFLVYEGVIDSQPVADFSWCPVTPLVGETVEFVDTSNEFPSGHAWDFEGDADTDSRSAASSYIFYDSGRYAVTLDVCNAISCDSHTETIGVGEAVITIDGPSTGAVLESLQFTASATGCAPEPEGWSWASEQGVVAPPNAAEVAISWQFAFEKELEVSNSACGRAIGSKEVTITGLGEPPATVPQGYELRCLQEEGDPDPNCDGNDIQPNLPTVVLTHGLQKRGFTPEGLWTSFQGPWGGGFLVHQYLESLGVEANVIQFVWHGAGQQERKVPWKSEYKEVHDHHYENAGTTLGELLLSGAVLGTGYSQPIHFIGHSFGTAVNAIAAAHFLAKATNVAEAQFTSLDRPHHIEVILPGPLFWSESDRERYQFDSCDYTETLRGAFAREDLVLKADNYFSYGIAGVGEEALGPFYDHEELVQPGELDFIFDEQPNDHSGVHMWYRWSANPVDDEGGAVCNGSVFLDPTENLFPGSLDDSLNPCRRGWFWSVLGTSTGWHEAEEGILEECPLARSEVTLGTPLALECGPGSSGNFICGGFAAVAGALTSSATSESFFSTVQIDVPEGAVHLVFDYEFGNLSHPENAAYASVYVDDTPVWVVSSATATSDETRSTPPLKIRGLRGPRTLTVALFPQDDLGAEIEFANFRFLNGIPAEQIDGALTHQAATEPEGVLSQEHELAQATLDSSAADDFTVPPEAAPWYLSQVVAEGSYDGAGGTPLFNVFIFSDSSGAPGTQVCAYDGLVAGTDFVDSGGSFTVTLPEICSLDAGTYWVSVQADMDSTQGSWRWSTRLPVGGGAAQWQNALGGQGLGCTGWTDASTCYGFPESRDLAFALYGPPSCAGPSYLHLKQETVDASQDFLACRVLTAGGGFTITGAGTEVTFRAGDAVALEDAFAVEAGATFSMVLGR